MPAAACHQPATTPAARAYRRRRPAATLLHELVRTHLETWLAAAERTIRPASPHVESELRT
ncbi:MAG: hypothetical protein IPI48_13125 [bacterium]|nr:hypothetical protein [bacterium]